MAAAGLALVFDRLEGVTAAEPIVAGSAAAATAVTGPASGVSEAVKAELAGPAVLVGAVAHLVATAAADPTADLQAVALERSQDGALAGPGSVKEAVAAWGPMRRAASLYPAGGEAVGCLGRRVGKVNCTREGGFPLDCRWVCGVLVPGGWMVGGCWAGLGV